MSLPRSTEATALSHRQSGITLVITLVMLVLITIVGVSLIRLSTTDERMAGNTRERDGLAAQPRCMVEQLGTGSANDRVTGHAVGASALAEVILRATSSTH